MIAESIVVQNFDLDLSDVRGLAGLADELYRTWLELEQRGLKKTPEYRNVMVRADRHAWWLAGLAKLSSPDPALPLSSKETERTGTLIAPEKAA
jgi:hypothetical protein